METTLTKPNTAVALSPDQLLSQAIDKDLDVEKLKQLMELQERWQAGIARKAFFDALAQFQIECPEIRKTKDVVFNGAKQYAYAPLPDVIRQIKEPLRKHGFSYRWEYADEGAIIRCTCLLTHSDGHTERTTMSANADASGSKNAIQARGSTIKYLERYSLTGALGITTADQDQDANIPQKSVDELHQEYMALLERLIPIDDKYRKSDPDNWKVERNAVNYLKAIHEAEKILAKHQSK